MKKLIVTTCALAFAAFSLTQMAAPADARTRHKGMTKSMAKPSMKPGTNNTGGLNASPSAAGGNAAQPSRSVPQGSGGGSGTTGQ